MRFLAFLPRFFLILLISLFLQPAFSKAVNQNPKALSSFEVAKPGYWYRFPQDHLAHPSFANEWWYYTGNLTSKRLNKEFGYQLTFFRVALEPGGESIYLAHFALSDLSKKKFYFSERVNRNILQKAGASSVTSLGATSMANKKSIKDVLVWNKDWSTQIYGTGELHQLNASSKDDEGNEYSIQLRLRTNKTPVIQGKKGEGLSRKGKCLSCASHYYSYPVLETFGKITVDGEDFQVSGKSWMDHEFGSSQLMENQVGWDWFSIQMYDGSSLMLYRMREKNGKTSEFSSGTFLPHSGQAQHLERKDFFLKAKKYWQSDETKVKYPLVWDVTVPSYDLGLRIIPKMTHQELVTQKSTKVSYWEGAIEVLDRVSGKRVGEGYLELTGYDGKLKGKF
ncbi:MAG: lipocalin-like domain-containing protein [Candidatus Caenarcaniphilales bacterium]|nr:lipocalin-like domain-containing protein [Candidatus Caenarcaniphilales bacterium]